MIAQIAENWPAMLNSFTGVKSHFSVKILELLSHITFFYN